MQPNMPPDEQPQKKESFFKEIVQLAFWALIIVVPFRIFIAQPFVVNGASMDPTFENGDYLIVDQLSYRFEEPTRGSVLIFKFPKDPKKFFIKRIIGLPGERVDIENGIVTITQRDAKTKETLSEPYIQFEKNDNFSITLKDGEYFVLGDNRLGSADSRIWGPVPHDLIVGRPVLRLFPLTHISFLPGDYSEKI